MSRLTPFLLALGTVASVGCASAIDSSYLLRGYDGQSNTAVKRIAVAAWAPADLHDVATLTTAIATDFVKLRKNYLVRQSGPVQRDFAEACDALDGVLAIRVLDVVVAADAVTTRLEASLYRCRDGALLWRTTGTLTASSRDENLQQLAAAYGNSAGPAAARFAAPLFALLQQLLTPMPDPVLSDDEILEKIDLG
jgi:probable lipoprotein (TIGR04455 family)